MDLNPLYNKFEPWTKKSGPYKRFFVFFSRQRIESTFQIVEEPKSLVWIECLETYSCNFPKRIQVLFFCEVKIFFSCVRIQLLSKRDQSHSNCCSCSRTSSTPGLKSPQFSTHFSAGRRNRQTFLSIGESRTGKELKMFLLPLR